MGCGNSRTEPLSDPYPQQKPQGQYNQDPYPKYNNRGGDSPDPVDPAHDPQPGQQGLRDSDNNIPAIQGDTPTERDEREHGNNRRVPNTDEVDDDADDYSNCDVTDLHGSGGSNFMGRTTATLDTRSNPDDVRRSRPDLPPGELWEDPEFSQHVAMKGLGEDLSWKRPGEFCSNPQLFTEGTTRFDIQQGGAGTCWFLSILASVADKPDVIAQIIPKDGYKCGTDAYDGVFHCRFWRFGAWVDVFIDDCLPVQQIDGSDVPWGARSCDPDELWVSLMEKAFAKFHGGYKSVVGGWAGDAFISLTGGVAERVEIDDITRSALFKRVNNALKCGSVIACSVPVEKDGQMGLVGGHAYTLTGATRLPSRGKLVPMFRVRNPWGTEKGEWKGRWQDGAPEWGDVTPEVKEKLQIKGRADGEFWMDLRDYADYFKDTHVCNFTPDFDKDGTTDGLDRVCCLLGEWRGPSAAGSDAPAKYNNPKFEITVPRNGKEETSPVVIQFIQKKENRLDDDYLYIRADVYEYELQSKDAVELHECTSNLTYFGGPSLSYRYSLKPGKYLVLPTAMNPGDEKEFCIRTFSAKELACREVKELPVTFLRKAELSFEHDGDTYNTSRTKQLTGGWRNGKNAGGQVSNDTYHTNPQVLVTLKGSGRVPLAVLLQQEHTDPRLAIGYKIFKVGKPSAAPLDLGYLYQNYNDAMTTAEGGHVFVVSYEAEGYHLLEPGCYVIVLFTDKAGDEKRFNLVLGTAVDTKMDCKSFNM